MTKVIRGITLIANKQFADFVDGFVDLLDPWGWNIIEQEIIHRDGAEMRLQILFKLVGQEEPFEGQLTVPFDVYTKMYQIVGEDGHVH